MKILGIDPGSARAGYALLTKEKGKITLTMADIIENKKQDMEGKIRHIGTAFELLFTEIRPDVIAIEKIFFQRNIKTAIEVAQARGVILFLAYRSGAKVVEFTPNQIKAAVTNYGSADKKAVAIMTARLLGLPRFNYIDDTTDAIAIAISAAFQER
ncbi:MAG: crossover junction endodeoxyribonuclease RuvC [Candidatus Harrisonbacteria bacterium]|nr:crossover junction endodeoxyribonuclease RuvC [Candidatus Harrisonbacteria bacterium]